MPRDNRKDYIPYGTNQWGERAAIWPDDYTCVCTICAEEKHRSYFGNGHQYRSDFCRDCAKLGAEKKVEARRENFGYKGVYSFVIRDEDTKKIYLWDRAVGDIPDGFSIVYTRQAGHTLPRRYWRYQPHEKARKTLAK